jgi:hypothetical protein
MTMNGQFDDELLSAYHDGELSDTERQSVAGRMADEPELRDVLEEYAELSSSLKSLPRSPAPEDLHAGVMRQVRSSSLAGSKAKASEPSRRQIWFWATGMVASLLIAAGVFQWTTGPRVEPGIVTAQATSDGVGRVVEPAEAQKVASSGAFGGGGFGSGAAQALADATPMEAAAPFPLDADPFAIDPQLKEMLDSLSEEPVSGQQLEMLQKVNDELVLVEYRVVDVNHAFGQVQYLLQQLGMRPISGEADLAGADSGSENRLQGIFLEAPREEMAAALGQIGTLENVVLVDAIEEDLARELGMDPGELPPAMQIDRSLAAEGTVNAAGDSERPAASSPVPADSPSTTPRPPAASSQSGAVAAPSEALAARYQLIPLNGDALRAIEEQQQEERAQQQGQVAPGAAQAEVANAREADRDEPDAARSPAGSAGRTWARILIVLVREKAAGND